MRYCGGGIYEGWSNALSDLDQEPRPQKIYRNTRYENNVAASQSEYFLISTLSGASPPYSLYSWLVDSDASRHFFGCKEVFSNLVERETSLNIILGDNTTYPAKGFGSISFHLELGEVIHLLAVSKLMTSYNQCI